MIETIPKKKKHKKAKWLSDEALQIAEKREAKGKGEKESYTHLNAGFQRIARRDKKAFPSDQHKEIEGKNRSAGSLLRTPPFHLIVWLPCKPAPNIPG